MDEIIDTQSGTAVRRVRNSYSPPNHVENQEIKPTDTGGTTYWSCVILGMSCLLPWNLFITAHGYFTYKFRTMNGNDTQNSTNENLAASFEGYFTLMGSASGVFGAIVNIVLTSFLSSNRRMIGGHVMVILALIMALVFSFVDTDNWQKGFLGLNLALIMISQIGCAFIASSVLGLAALLPETSFMNGVISAQGFCGIFAAVINIISIAVGSMRPSLVGGVYFGLAVAFTLFSLGVYFSLLKNSYAQYYVKKAQFHIINDDTEPLIPDSRADSLDDESDVSLISSRAGTAVTPWRRLIRIIRKTLYHGMVLLITLMATLTCFPALTSLVMSTAAEGSIWHTYFIPVTCFLLFGTMDFASRCLGNWILWPKPGSVLIGIFAMARFGFVVLFLFCNLPPKDAPGLPRVFDNDMYYVLFIALLGLTNGYLANLVCTYLPFDVDVSDREKTGAASAFYVAVGVLLGSIASLSVVKGIV